MFGKTLSSDLTLKTKWYHSCCCCDYTQSREKMKRPVTDKYFEEKVRLLILITD